MKQQSVNSSVFLEEKPSINTLKACTFFWKNICVYESYIETLPDTPELYDISRLLLEKGILKIAVDNNNEFRSGLSDKIYASLDSDFWRFLHKNADKVTIVTELPDNVNNLIKESSEIEYEDKNLQELIDYYVYKQIEDEQMFGLFQSLGVPFDTLPKDFQNKALEGIKDIVNFRYNAIHNFPPRERYYFEWVNESLLLKFSVSSAIFSSIYQLPYYVSVKSFGVKYFLRCYLANNPFEYPGILELHVVF